MPLGFKRWTDADGEVHGRLEIGFLRGGLGFAYYEPIDPPGSPQVGPDIAIFADKRGYKTERKVARGDPASWDAMLEQVYWHVWAKPFPGETEKRGKASLVVQRRDLYDMWCYLMATDPAEVAERAAGLNKPGFPRRLAFYNVAKEWKDRDMTRIAAKAKQMGREMKDMEPASDDEDEGYEVDEEEAIERMVEKKKRKRGDMGPPNKPSKKKRKKDAKIGGFPGSAGQRRVADRPFGAGKSHNAPRSLFVTPAVMSGGRGDAGSERHGGFRRGHSADVINGQDLDDVDDFSDIMDFRPPEETGSSPTPSSREQSARPGNIPGIPRAVGGGGSAVTGEGYVHPTVESACDYGGHETTMSRREKMRKFNGGTGDEDEDLDRGLRESSAAHQQHQQRDLTAFGDEFRNPYGLSGQAENRDGPQRVEDESIGWASFNAGQDDDEAMRTAIRASTEPKERNDVFNIQVDRNASIPSDEETARKMRGSASQDHPGNAPEKRRGPAGPFEQDEGESECGKEAADGAIGEEDGDGEDGGKTGEGEDGGAGGADEGAGEEDD